MFVDFDEVFNKNPDSQFEIPEKYVEYLNKKLPKDMKYSLNKDGSYTLTSDKETVNIDGLVFKLTPAQKEILGENPNIEKVLNYSYNAQEKIKTVPVDGKNIIINGKKTPIDRINVDLHNMIEKKEKCMYLIPPKFPKSVPLEFGDGEYNYKLNFSRVPSKDVNILCFESEPLKPLYVTYNINKINKNIKINFTFEANYANSIKEIVESLSIYNSFSNGSGYIDNKPVKLNVEGSINPLNDAIVFWGKILEIEQLLNIKIKISKENLEDFNSYEVERLYQTLINKKPVIDQNIVDVVKGNWNESEIDIFKKNISNPISFMFQTTKEIEIFKNKLTLPTIVVVFNSRIEKIYKEKNMTKISLIDESETNKRYASIMYFKNEQEMKKYSLDFNNDKMKLFQKAPSVKNILNNKKDIVKY